MASEEILQYCGQAGDFPIFCRVLRRPDTETPWKVRYVKVTHGETVQKLRNEPVTREGQLKILQQLPGWNTEWKTLHVDEENGQVKCLKDTFETYPGPDEYTAKLDLPKYTFGELEFVKRVQNYAKVWTVKMHGTEYYAKFVNDLHVVDDKYRYVTPWETKVMDNWNVPDDENNIDEKDTRSTNRKLGFKYQAVPDDLWGQLETEIKAYSVLEGTSLAPKLVGYITARDYDEGDIYIKDPGFETHEAVGILLESAGDIPPMAHKNAIRKSLNLLHCHGIRHEDLSLYNVGIIEGTTTDSDIKNPALDPKDEGIVAKFIDFQLSKFDNGLIFWDLVEEEKEVFEKAELRYLS